MDGSGDAVEEALADAATVAEVKHICRGRCRLEGDCICVRPSRLRRGRSIPMLQAQVQGMCMSVYACTRAHVHVSRCGHVSAEVTTSLLRKSRPCCSDQVPLMPTGRCATRNPPADPLGTDGRDSDTPLPHLARTRMQMSAIARALWRSRGQVPGLDRCS